MSWISGYNKLTWSGLPFGWAAILVGKQLGKVSDEDTVAFALDLIASASEKYIQTVALLANTDPHDWQTIHRYLEELASHQSVERQTCLHLWRYADLKYLLEAALPRDKIYTSGEWCALGYALVDVLSEYDELSDTALLDPRWGEKPEDMMQRYQNWLIQEASVLKTI